MCGVAVDYHRAARSESRCRVASCNRIGEREVARTKDGYRADRTQHRSYIRFWQRLAVRDRVIDARIHPRAFIKKIGKHPKLPACTGALALEACVGQRRFERSPPDQRV